VIPKLKMTKSVMTATKLMEMDAHQRAKKKAIAIQQIKAITPKQNAQAVFKMLIIMSYSNRLPASAHVGF
jgi:ribosomal protein L20A (L18A)